MVECHGYAFWRILTATASISFTKRHPACFLVSATGNNRPMYITGEQLTGIPTSPTGFPREWEGVTRLLGNRNGNDIFGMGKNRNVTFLENSWLHRIIGPQFITSTMERMGVIMHPHVPPLMCMLCSFVCYTIWQTKLTPVSFTNMTRALIPDHVDIPNICW